VLVFLYPCALPHGVYILLFKVILSSRSNVVLDGSFDFRALFQEAFEEEKWFAEIIF